MNIIKIFAYRTYQVAFRIALPILPYRNPIIINEIEKVYEVILSNEKRNPLIVTDGFIRNLEVFKILEESLKSNNVNYNIFSDVVANPTSDNVNQALSIYKENNCDCLIAIGGGSVMDCAKAMGALIARPKKTLADLAGILHVRHKIPLLIAIPTTCGTGSETTLAAVIVDSKTRHKYAINDFPLIPKYAVLDSKTIKTLPKSLVSTTGLDALTHAIEAYIGRSTTKSTRKDALDAIKLIFENIELASLHDEAALKNMLDASHKAGRAFSKSYVGYVHALAHSLGGKYNIAHGYANAVILPIVLKEYGTKIYKKLAKIADYCELGKGLSVNGKALLVLSRIDELNNKLNIASSIPEIKEEDIDEMAKYAVKEANPLYPVPVLWDLKKMKEMYYKIKGEDNE